MYVVIICSLLALFLAYKDSKGQIKYGLEIGFILITLLSALHYDYGNDYMHYLSMYRDVETTPFDTQSILAGDLFKDPGWVLLEYFFKPIGGFFSMVFCLSIYQNFVVYRIIKKYVERKWWVFSVFIYLFTPTLYLLSFSMLRQSFVVYTFLAVLPLIINKKWYIVLPILYLCSLVHGSAIVLLPFAFFGFIPIQNSKVISIFVALLLLLLWFSKDFLNSIFMSLVSTSNFEESADYYANSIEITATYGLGFFLGLIPLFLSLYYLFKNEGGDKYKRLIVLFAITGFIITPFAQIIPIVNRLSFYFSIYQIVALPLVYNTIKNHTAKYLYLGLFVLVTIVGYYYFFTGDTYSIPYSSYHTIFDAL